MKLYILVAVCFALISSYYSQEASKVEVPGRSVLGQFALHISKTIVEAEPEKNVVVSPLSIYGALLLALLGSSGNTQSELANALHLGSYLSKNDLVSAYKDLGQLLSKTQAEANETKIFLSDAVFVNDKVKISDKYIQEAKEYFNSEVQSVNFADETKATEILNGWVSKKTNGQISKILDTPLDGSTVSLLASALHFEAEWETKFPSDMSKKSKFYSGVGKEIEVDYVSIRKSVLYHYSDKFTAVGIPYKGRDAFFHIILPNENESVSSLLKTLSHQDFISVIRNTRENYIDLSIPKLKLQYGKELKEILQSLGVASAFKAGSADFSSLAPNLYIDSVFHKTQLHLNESGTVASAVTTIGFLSYSAPPQVFVNKPFIFIINQAKTGVTLFAGAVYNPLNS